MDLSEKIALARQKFDLEAVMNHYGVGHLCKKSAKSPFRDDKNPSFSVFRDESGRLRWKDFATGETGDEIDFIMKMTGMEKQDARAQWFALAGLPPETPKGKSSAVERARASMIAANGAAGVAAALTVPFVWDDCVRDFDEKWVETVAAWRGYRPAFVRWLRDQGLIGVYEDCCAFPIHDASGKVVGPHYRTEHSGWLYIKGTRVTPWMLGNVLDESQTLIIHESQWDALALWDLLRVDETGELLPQAVARGQSNAKGLADVLAARKSGFNVVFQQNDKPLEKDEKPRGNWKFRQDLMSLRGDLLFCAPPEGIKDLNDWLKAGASDDDVRGVLDASEKVRRSSLTVRTVKELLGMKFDDSDNYLADRMLAAGQFATFLGPPGVGKSRVIMQMAICCILGRDFLGLKTHARNKKWLFMQTENNNRRLQFDLKRFISGFGLTEREIDIVDRCLMIHTIETDADGFLDLTVAGDYQEVAGTIADFNPDIVVWDPLAVFSSGDLNSDQDMRAVYMAMRLATNGNNPLRTGLIVHHSLSGKAGVAKASGWDKGSYGRNSKGLAGHIRSQFNLSRADPDDDNVLMLACGKNNNGAAFPDFGVVFDPETGIYEEDPDFDQEAFRAAADGKRVKANPLVASSTIARLFTGRISAKALHEILKETFPGVNDRQRYNYINKAVADRFLKEVGRGPDGKIYEAGKSAKSDDY